MIINQKKYTHKVKLSTLRLLEKNDFNYLRTEKQTGITRATIKKWEGQYGSEVFSGRSPMEVALEEVDKTIVENDKNMISQYYEIKKMILKRIMELAPNETKLESLANVFKVLTMASVELKEKGDKEEKSDINLIQVINQQCEDMTRNNVFPNGYEKNKDQGE